MGIKYLAIHFHPIYHHVSDAIVPQQENWVSPTQSPPITTMEVEFLPPEGPFLSTRGSSLPIVVVLHRH